MLGVLSTPLCHLFHWHILIIYVCMRVHFTVLIHKIISMFLSFSDRQQLFATNLIPRKKKHVVHGGCFRNECNVGRIEDPVNPLVPVQRLDMATKRLRISYTSMSSMSTASISTGANSSRLTVPFA